MTLISPVTHKVSLDVGAQRLIHCRGSRIYCSEASLKEFEVALNGNSRFSMYPSSGYQMPIGSEKIERLEVFNDNGNEALTATFVIGDGEFIDERSNFADDLSTKEDIPEGFLNKPDVTVSTNQVTKVIPADVRSVQSTLFNTHPSLIMRFGDSLIGPNRGGIIPPQGSATVAGRADLYVYHEIGQDWAVPRFSTIRT